MMAFIGMDTSVSRKTIEYEPFERWPVDRIALVALVDLGMTVEQLARYFGVEPYRVHALCARYSLTAELVDDRSGRA